MLQSTTTAADSAGRRCAISISDCAAEFISRWKLEADVERALRLVSELFPAGNGTVIKKEEDPEFSDEWISISIGAAGTVNEIADAYDQYVLRWVSSTPAEQIRKVRLQVGAA